jgi:hypothetical protein
MQLKNRVVIRRTCCENISREIPRSVKVGGEIWKPGNAWPEAKALMIAPKAIGIRARRQ